MRSFVPVAVVAALLGAAAMPSAAEDTAKDTERSTRDLDRFIGKWRFVDEATELAGFEYREEGVTECHYALDDAYIQCDGVGGSNNKTRHWVDYLNYNSITGDFERVGMFGNHPAKSSFTMRLSDDGQVVELFGAPMKQRDGSTTVNWGVIEFQDENNFTWNTRLNRSTQPPDHWPLSFVGVYERIE